MHLTIKDVLQLFHGQSVCLNAGKGGIDNPVSSVNIMDAPDIWNWVKPGDLILTTAFAVKDDISLQEKLIRELAAAGCSGIGVKTKRFLPEIPAVMKQAADECNLPLLELPLGLTLAEIMNPIISNIADKQSYLLQRSNEIHKALTQVAITSGGLNAIVECLGELIQCPVGCFNTSGVPLSMWVPDSIPGMSENDISAFKEYLLSVNSQNKDLQKRLSNTKSPFTSPVIVGGKVLIEISFAIMSSNEYFGHISILQSSDVFSDINHLALEHTCTVAALDFLKQKAVAESRRLQSRDMLDRILFRDLDNQTTQELFDSSKLGQAKTFYCSVIELDDTSLEVNLPVINTKLYKSANAIISSQYPLSLISEHAGKIIVLIAIPQSKVEIDCNVYVKIQKIFREVFSGISISIGIGTTVNSITSARQSYQDALTCISLGRKIKGFGQIILPHDVAGYTLLVGKDIPKMLSKVCEETIKRLEKVDQSLGMDLLKTLEKYLECDKNSTETAKELFIHRNTLSNRLERISELGCIDFNNRELLFCLRLALRQKKVLQ